MSDGTEIQEHLKLKSEQKLKRLTGLTINEKNVNNFFESRQLGPIIHVAWYNPTTDKYVLGPPGYFVPNSSFTTTSQAALTLTCAAGHRYRVYWAGCRNATQVSSAALSGTLGGNSWTDFIEVRGTVSTTITCIGGSGPFTDAIGGAYGATTPNEIWMSAGDTLTMTLSAYAAGNNTEHLFLFEDYTI